jgi:SAM-dependent methyltransferase
MIKMDVAGDSKLAAQRDPIESTVQFYETHAREYFQRTVMADLSTIYDKFSKSVHLGARVLDAGCGSGRDLKNLRTRGYDVMGIDASAALVELAKEYSGADCFTMRFEDLSFANQFDAIWACASLLHIPKTKLIFALQQIRGALVRGGILFASVQCGEGEMIAPDGRYFAYYGEDEFADLLKMAGFRVGHAWISKDTLACQRSLRWLNVFAHDRRAI